MSSETNATACNKSIADPKDCRLSSYYIHELIKHAVNDGHSREEILERAGLAAANVDDPHYSIDGIQLYKLFISIEKATNDIFAGFLQQPAKKAVENVHTKLAVQASSLGEAIRVSTQLREQLRNDVQYQYIHDDEHHTFSLGISGYDLKPETSEYLFYWVRHMQIYRYYSWLIGRKMKLNEIGFTCDNPDEPEMNAIFGCEVKFNQATNYICFDKHYLTAAVIRTETELLARDIDHNYPNWFVVPGYDHSWARKVEDKLTELFRQRGESTSLDNVAAQLRVSSRTLRRQLLMENEYFQQLKDKVRCKLAVDLLVNTDTPMNLVSDELGFTEPCSFTRAFLSWKGTPPSTFRKEQRARQQARA